MRYTTFLIIAALLLCSCGGGGGGGDKKNENIDKTPPEIEILALGMLGDLDESATVTVNSVNDDDGLTDDSFSVLINMGSNGIPTDPDPGNNAAAALNMSASDPSGNVGGHDLDLTIKH